MATSLVINGVSYLYPDTGDQSWGSVASAWAAAVTNGMLQKAGGTFTLTGTVNFGTAYGLTGKYFAARNIPVSVIEYGAKGDGSTDDTTAIQAALTSLSSGGDLYFPAGTYIYSSPLTPANGTRLFGDGATSILKRKAGSYLNTGTFYGAINKNDAQNITVERLKFDGLGSWTSTPFANPSGGGNSVGFNNGELAIQFKKASTGCSNVKVLDCEFTGYNHGVYVDGGAQASTSNVLIRGCYFHTLGANAIALFNVAKFGILNNNVQTIQGNITAAADTSTSSSKYGDGIYIAASCDGVIANNYVYDFIRAGIVVQPNGVTDYSFNLDIANNVVRYGNGSRGTEYNSGIYLGDGYINLPNTLTGNVIYDMGTGGNGVGYGLVLEHCNVVGGSVYNCASAGIYPNAYVTLNGVDVQGNKYGINASSLLAGNPMGVKNCTFKSNTFCGASFYQCKGTIEVSNCRFEDNGGSTTSRSAIGSCSGLSIDRYYSDQKVLIRSNTFVSSANAAATSGQLYAILAYAGGDSNFSTEYITGNHFIFTGTLASYPSSLGAVPESFAYDSGSAVNDYEICNDYGNMNSKLPYSEGYINGAYASAYPRMIGFARAAPVAGTYRTGDYLISDRMDTAGLTRFMCTSGGTPGTWQTWSELTDGTQTIAGNKTFSGTISASNLSGSNTGDQTITLTGDVTGTGTGSFATTVAKIQTVTVSGTTGTGNVVFSASPTLTGTALCSALTTSARIGIVNAPDSTCLLSIDNSRSQAVMSGTTQGGIGVFTRGTTASTAEVYGVKVATGSPSSGTCTLMAGFELGSFSSGGSTVTRSVGFWSNGVPSIGTNNAIFADNTSFTGNWGINLSGSSANTLGSGKTTVQTFQVAALTTAGPTYVDGSGNFSSEATLSLTRGGTGGSSAATARANLSVAPTVQEFTSTGSTVGYLFTITSGNATAGATYTNNGQTFTVINTIAASTYLFTTSAGAPAASGTLTKSGGTGDATITFSTSQALAAYTMPSNVVWVHLRGVAGGGGGAGSGTGAGAGGTGGLTAFSIGPIIATGGVGGSTTGSGGAGGTVTKGTALGAAKTGGRGGPAFNVSASTANGGGYGAVSPFGGAGVSTQSGTTAGIAGLAAENNSGSGGGGAGGAASAYGGAGGGAGGYFDLILTSPASGTYYYTIGAAGAAGAGSGFQGGAGGTGYLWTEEHYL